MADPTGTLEPRPGDSSNMLLQKILLNLADLPGTFLPVSGGTITGNLTVDGTTTLKGPVALGGATADSNIAVYLAGTVTGATGKYGFIDERIAGADVTSAWVGFSTSPGTVAAAFTLAAIRHFSTGQGTFGAGSSVTLQTGFNVNSNMVGAATNYAFRGQLPVSGVARYNLYMDGTAPNYLKGALTVDGVVAIGNTVAAGVGVASTHKMTIVVGGNTYYALLSNV